MFLRQRPGHKRRKPIIVRRAPGQKSQARVQLSHGILNAAIGRGGIKALKREGDGGTPSGRWPIRALLYRQDRGKRPFAPFPTRPICPFDGWCDDPASRNYNRPVRLPATASAEGMYRADHLYDLVLVLGYNDRPRIKGRGSAIFVHLARPGYTPTEGCIALSRRDFLALLAEAGKGRSPLVIG